MLENTYSYSYDILKNSMLISRKNHNFSRKLTTILFFSAYKLVLIMLKEKYIFFNFNLCIFIKHRLSPLSIDCYLEIVKATANDSANKRDHLSYIY